MVIIGCKERPRRHGVDTRSFFLFRKKKSAGGGDDLGGGNGSGSFESTTDAVDAASSRMISRLPFSNHNAIESSTSSANAFRKVNSFKNPLRFVRHKQPGDCLCVSN